MSEQTKDLEDNKDIESIEGWENWLENKDYIPYEGH